MAQQSLVTTGVPKLMASMAGMPNDSQLLMSIYRTLKLHDRDPHQTIADALKS